MHAGVRPRTLISVLVICLIRSLEAAFSRHVAWLATVQAELVLEASVLLLLGEFLEFLGKGIDLSAIFFCCGGTILVTPQQGIQVRRVQRTFKAGKSASSDEELS